MARYSMDSRLNPERVMRKATAFFGAEGLGLDMIILNCGCLYFEGEGGHVMVAANEGEDGSTVDLGTRGWDFQVREFLRTVAR